MREIAVSHAMAKITKVETLPPHYHIAMEQIRDTLETVHVLDTSRIDRKRYQGCPYCQNRSVFTCDCGVLSCCNASKDIHCCPHCGDICETTNTTELPASPSGFVHQPQQTPPRVQTRGRVVQAVKSYTCNKCGEKSATGGKCGNCGRGHYVLMLE